MKKPIFTMVVGLPGSGKSTWLEKHKEELDFTIHSYDAIRAEFGDVNDQSKNELVFATLHKRIKEDLLNGKNVAYDATNLSRKRRINFISNELRDIPCEKICVLFAAPIDVCKKNNANRERKVPEEVIERMIRNFEVPAYCEGWNDIQIVWWDWEKESMKFDFHKDLVEWCLVQHNNPHHTKSIGDHMIVALNHYVSIHNHNEKLTIEEYLLSVAVLMHDCGKTYVKSFYDKYGNLTDKARFYEHHNVGSYLSLFYLKDSCYEYDNIDYTDDDILYISLLINCHMRHFMAYKDSDKARERDRRLFGDDFMKSLDVLHECDLAAH